MNLMPNYVGHHYNDVGSVVQEYIVWIQFASLYYPIAKLSKLM